MKLIPIKEAAELTKITDQSIRNWIDKGELNKYEMKGVVAIDKGEILRKLPTVIGLFNQKGGVGKTSTAVLLSDYFEKKKYKTLLIDLDQQGNLSQTYLDFEEIQDNPTIYEYLENHTSLKKIVRSYNEHIDIIPADIRLAKKETIDTSILIKFKKDFMSFFKEYQVVIIDCPPALNAFSRLAILLSHYIFLPLNEEPYCFIGLADAIDTINTMKAFNTNFIDYKAFTSKHIGTRSVIRKTMNDEYKQQLKDKFIDITVPNFIGIVERATTRENIFDSYNTKDDIKRIESLFENIHTFIYEGR